MKLKWKAFIRERRHTGKKFMESLPEEDFGQTRGKTIIFFAKLIMHVNSKLEKLHYGN